MRKQRLTELEKENTPETIKTPYTKLSSLKDAWPKNYLISQEEYAASAAYQDMQNGTVTKRNHGYWTNDESVSTDNMHHEMTP
jgi:hypothetical protein